MTDKELMSAAARLRAARRRTVEKRCLVCGTGFTGLVTRRYCSDRCRVQASRERSDEAVAPQRVSSEGNEDAGLAAARRKLATVGMDRRDGEDLGAYLDRIRAYFSQGEVFDDSTELIRQSRIERTNDLVRSGGHEDWVDEA